MSNSTRSKTAKTEKPKKPYKAFPLTAHASGKWSKKIRGDTKYFGAWAKRENGKLVRVPGDGWKEALELYKAQADDLHAGRTPRTRKGDELTVGDLCNAFLTAKTNALRSGEIASRTFREYNATTDRLVAKFGIKRVVDDLHASEFETLRADIAKTCGPVRLGNEVQRVRTVFKYGFESGLIEKPVRFGPSFRKPSKTVLRKHKAKNGKRIFDTTEIRSLLAAAGPQLRAMILLGVNCGFGNSDCGTLPRSVVDLSSGWIRYPRPKTGVERECPLWPETIDAMKVVLDSKNVANDAFVFVTKYGRPWAVDGDSGAVSGEFGKLLRACRLEKPGRGFYALRHTFRTVADGTRDFPAVRLIMGHADGSIDAVYREHIDPERLEAVTDFVRGWLFPKDDAAE